MKKNIYLALSFFFILSANSQEITQSLIDNLTNEQITAAKSVIEANDTDEEKIDGAKEIKESLKDNKIREVSIISEYRFGYDFITTSPTSIIATSDLPLPNDYILSIGDVISVTLSGARNQIFDLDVQLDGSILFPDLGAIYVVGENFKDVKLKLINLVQQAYIGVNIDLSLKDLSAKKITIVGTVNNPGTYLVNPFTTISNALAYSGGVKDIGSLRSIKLIKTNGDIFEFDLYDLLIFGDRTKDKNIDSGDVIIVNAADKFINITGEVKRPGLYEIKSNENLSDALSFALGFSGGANVQKITLSKLDPKKKILYKVITDDLTYDLQDVIDIQVFKFQNQDASGIYVEGAIKEPGFYDLENNKNLEQLIKNLNFVDVYPWLATLEQFDVNNLIQSTILFSLKDPATYKSIELLPNSRVYFSNINDINFSVNSLTRQKIADYELKLNHKQGSFNLPIYGKFSVNSLIDFLGLDMSDVDIEATYVSPLDGIVLKDSYKNMEFEAKKYHTVSFRSPINNLINVTITGEIDYPGVYTLQSDTTLEDLYGMIGGFKKEAYFDGIIFTRESVRKRQMTAISKSKADLNEAILARAQRGENIGDVNVIRALSETIEPQYLGRIAGDFSPESMSSINTILFDGDAIVIPRNPNIINILGEVLNPTAIEYKKRISINEAISTAGGFKDYAKRSSVYVIKANGLIERANRNIFTKSISLEPGDSIIVPRKIITNNPGIDALLPITQILSDLSFSAAALESLSNNN